jgi:ribonuclease Z
MAQRGLSLLRVTLLGTSAAQPTANRNLSGIAMRADADLVLFDCGEGTQRQMARFGVGLDLDAVFFTHFHADHYLGIIGLLRSLGMLGRQRRLPLYGPAPARTLLDQAIHLGIEALTFPVDLHELAPGDQVARPGYRVHAVAADHRTPALSYVVVEETRPGHFDVAAAAAQGVPPGPRAGQLQRGQSVTLDDGRVVQPSDVLGPERPGRRLAISGDTRPTAALAAAARDVDLLIHESTFCDDEQARAVETRHSTAREAARVAAQAGARRLVLTHLSSRYDKEPARVAAEAATEYAGPLQVADDGLVIELLDAPAGPHSPAARPR